MCLSFYIMNRLYLVLALLAVFLRGGKPAGPMPKEDAAKEESIGMNGKNRNFQREMDRLIEKNEGEGIVPTLFLHSCCAPCSSYVLEYLSRYFKITVYYYNPNIYPPSEYEERTEEVKRLIRELPVKNEVSFVALALYKTCYHYIGSHILLAHFAAVTCAAQISHGFCHFCISSSVMRFDPSA